MDTTDVAMVSRIRIEVRGGSMEAAEKAAFTVLEHAMQAAFYEGLTSGRGEYTDHFFNRPEVTRKYEEGGAAEPWGELGLAYGGRLAFTFLPAASNRAIKQHGYTVMQEEDYTPHGLLGHPDSTEHPVVKDITEWVFVLPRSKVATEESVGIRIGPGPFVGEKISPPYDN